MSFRDLVASADEAFDAGDYRRAARGFADAAACAPTPSDRASALKNGAIARRRLGDVAGALELGLRARAVLSEDPEEGVAAEVDLLVGNCLADQGEFQRAELELASASERFEHLGRHTEFVQATIARARVLGESGETDKSQAFFFTLKDQPLPDALRSQVLNNLGVLQKRAGELQAALDLFMEDTSLCQATGDTYGEGIARLNAAGVYAAMDKSDEAAKWASNAAELFERLGSRDALREVHQFLEGLAHTP